MTDIETIQRIQVEYRREVRNKQLVALAIKGAIGVGLCWFIWRCLIEWTR